MGAMDCAGQKSIVSVVVIDGWGLVVTIVFHRFFCGEVCITTCFDDASDIASA